MSKNTRQLLKMSNNKTKDHLADSRTTFLSQVQHHYINFPGSKDAGDGSHCRRLSYQTQTSLYILTYISTMLLTVQHRDWIHTSLATVHRLSIQHFTVQHNNLNRNRVFVSFTSGTVGGRWWDSLSEILNVFSDALAKESGLIFTVMLIKAHYTELKIEFNSWLRLIPLQFSWQPTLSLCASSVFIIHNPFISLFRSVWLGVHLITPPLPLSPLSLDITCHVTKQNTVSLSLPLPLPSLSPSITFLSCPPTCSCSSKSEPPVWLPGTIRVHTCACGWAIQTHTFLHCARHWVCVWERASLLPHF